MIDRYGKDVLSGDWKSKGRLARPTSRALEATRGMVVEDVETGWVGAVVALEKAGGQHVVHLEDRRGRVKAFPLGPGFLIDGKPVELTAPRTDTAALAAQRLARLSRVVLIVDVGFGLQADELAGHLVGVCGEAQLLTLRAQHLVQGRADHRHDWLRGRWRGYRLSARKGGAAGGNCRRRASPV